MDAVPATAPESTAVVATTATISLEDHEIRMDGMTHRYEQLKRRADEMEKKLHKQMASAKIRELIHEHMEKRIDDATLSQADLSVRLVEARRALTAERSTHAEDCLRLRRTEDACDFWWKSTMWLLAVIIVWMLW